ncbi:hypothetical protein C8R44DRAFT_872247 [Mycena epipterygia]|nr:hypothetical protein C8R44DRAFT_872247 [Mycena epipterygia]
MSTCLLYSPGFLKSGNAMLLLLFVIHMLSKNSSLVQGNILYSRTPVDSCDDINSCRRLFDIIWGCLVTVFACTWVSRLKLMLIAIIVPEFMVGFAARQFLAAWMFSKDLEVSMTHGFFISMGGFVSRIGHHPIVTKKQLKNPDCLSAIQSVEEEDINDKGNSDAFSKGIALIQGLWFITQCMARVHQHLPVTQLEVATLAFAVINILIWALWWGKPLDVAQPILIGSTEDLREAEFTIQDLNLKTKFEGVLLGDYSPYLPVTSTSVPTFWAMDWEEAIDEEKYIPFYIKCLVGTVFGAIHCAAWNTDFPSTIEMWMWRSCSLAVAAIPAALGSFSALDGATTTGSAIEDTTSIILNIIFAVSIPLYPIARLFLIIIPFTSLRALPHGAFIDVDWSVYIPHL